MSIFLGRLERFLQVKVDIFSFRDLFFIMLALHLFILSMLPTDVIWDENIYSLAAIGFLNGQASYIERPFLGYLWIASGVAIFGTNWFGYRSATNIRNVLAIHL